MSHDHAVSAILEDLSAMAGHAMHHHGQPYGVPSHMGCPPQSLDEMATSPPRIIIADRAILK